MCERRQAGLGNRHRLDFAITILGVMELASDLTGGTGGFVTVFRTARFFRLFKVLKTSRGLRSLLNTCLSALPGVMNIMMLMVGRGERGEGRGAELITRSETRILVTFTRGGIRT